MWNIDANSILWINGIVIGLFIFLFIRGWHKGILRTLLSLFATGLSIYFAYIWCGALGTYAQIFPKDWAPMQDTFLATDVYAFCNQIICFVVLFILLRILFWILDRVLKNFNQIPIVKQVSSILGGVLGIIEAVVWCMVLSIVLSTPIFKNGTYGISNSFLSPVQQTTSTVLSNWIAPLLETEEASSIMEQSSDLTQAQQDFFESFMKQYGNDSE